MTRRSLAAAAAVLASLSGAPVVAATVLADDFAAYGAATQLNAADAVFGGVWRTVDGTVDFLAAGSSFGNLCRGDAACVDLDGSTLNSGRFETVDLFDAGRYAVSFAIYGSGRGTTEDVTVSFGDFLITQTLLSGDALVLSGFATVGAGGARLAFSTPSNDNIGPVLTSVSVAPAPIPLPAAAPLLLGALSVLGALRLRRRG